MINVLIVDDHELFRQGISALFSGEEGIQVVDTTHNGFVVPELVRRHKIDVILLDMSMPILDGPGVLELLQQEGEEVPVLMLTVHAGLNEIKKALTLGAAGYVLKDANKATLKQAIEALAGGGNYFHQKIQQQMIDFFRGQSKQTKAEESLSERELEIVRELAKGDSGPVIADRLHLSEYTVRSHRRNILHKLGAKNTAELIHMAMERGWI
ncbi:MAG TPA: hypothetical protein DCE41_07030 [Cytophagales bacterium]|nr:hypothetical protein [Cytophagales bacterium]HAA22032.1 hypothetical protein [Cytophagales bacterium]HAP58597.1 hypothetical protein [Cytophagales bacterium]